MQGRYRAEQWPIVRRMIHANADFEFNGLTDLHPEAVTAGIAAIRRGGTPVVADVEMICSGLSAPRLAHFGMATHQFISDADVIAAAQAEDSTRAVQAMRKAHRLGLLQGAIVGIGNAPTALIELVRLIREEGLRPALVIGMPVGFEVPQNYTWQEHGYWHIGRSQVMFRKYALEEYYNDDMANQLKVNHMEMTFEPSYCKMPGECRDAMDPRCVKVDRRPIGLRSPDISDNTSARDAQSVAPGMMAPAQALPWAPHLMLEGSRMAEFISAPMPRRSEEHTSELQSH